MRYLDAKELQNPNMGCNNNNILCLAMSPQTTRLAIHHGGKSLQLPCDGAAGVPLCLICYHLRKRCPASTLNLHARTALHMAYYTTVCSWFWKGTESVNTFSQRSSNMQRWVNSERCYSGSRGCPRLDSALHKWREFADSRPHGLVARHCNRLQGCILPLGHVLDA